jgi:hypothetical protein
MDGKRIGTSALAALVAWVGLAAPSAAQHCGCEHVLRPCCTCERHHHECRHHCCFKRLEAPPQAPILGSAPALMAPVIFTTAGPAALPAAAPPPPVNTEALRELLRALDQPAAAPAVCSCGGAKSASPGAAMAPPQPPRDDAMTEQLSRIEQNIATLHEAVMRIDSVTASKLREFDARLNNAIQKGP